MSTIRYGITETTLQVLYLHNMRLVGICYISVLCAHKYLIESNRKVRLEASPIDRVDVVGGALVDAGVHLGGRIDFDLRLHLVLADAPLVHLAERTVEIVSIVDTIMLKYLTLR